MFNHGSLFSGIGGFDLAAEWMGWNNVFHCEWNPFGQKVLKHYWPNAISYGDITKTDFTIHRGNIDILTGGFPCQPYSLAGKRKGKEDERHLWPEMLRVIREVAPTYIVGENVYGLLNWNGGLVFDEVQADLESEGYEVQPVILPACGVNAPHKRERIWFVAYSGNERCNNWSNNWKERHIQTDCRITSENKPEWNGRECGISKVGSIITNTGLQRQEERQEQSMWVNEFCKEWSAANPTTTRERRNEWKSKSKGNIWEQFPTQSPICGGDDGLPTELDGVTFPKWKTESLKAFGNAIVPQVALQIFEAIQMAAIADKAGREKTIKTVEL